jgi:hypothetical protein
MKKEAPIAEIFPAWQAGLSLADVGDSLDRLPTNLSLPFLIKLSEIAY